MKYVLIYERLGKKPLVVAPAGGFNTPHEAEDWAKDHRHFGQVWRLAEYEVAPTT